jgi:hypothetical protein
MSLVLRVDPYYSLSAAALLNTGNLQRPGQVRLDLLNPGAGLDHGKVAVTGTVVLDPTISSLLVSVGQDFRPVMGSELVLISNDGTDAVSGTFAQMPEGTEITLNGGKFRISYVGGDGNDVSLTCVFAPKTWTGAVDNKWSTAGNWVNGVPTSGDALRFPSNASSKSMLNDLAPGVFFSSVIFADSSYSIVGNGFGITKELRGQSTNIDVAVDVGANSVVLESVSLRAPLGGTGPAQVSNLSFTGGHPYAGTITGGNVTLAAGASVPAATFNTSAYSYLSGSGTTGPLSGSWNINIGGNSSTPGILQTGSLGLTNGYVTLRLLSTGADQIRVAGTVTLSSTSLQLQANSTPNLSPGAVITLVANDGADPVSGTFYQYAEGAAITIGPRRFKLSYVGGDGNDITLQCMLCPKTFTGVAGGLWSNPANWADGVVPQDGDSVYFPYAAPQTSVNDLPAGLRLQAMIFDTNHSLTGNGIRLTESIQGNYNGPTIFVPIDVGTNPVTISSAILSGAISGTGSISATTTTIKGGPHPYAGTITFFNSLALDDATLPAATVATSGSTLSGTGSAATMRVAGWVYPGKPACCSASYGILESPLFLISTSSSTNFNFEVKGTTPGVTHDQIKTTGSFILPPGLANLSIQFDNAYNPIRGDTITLVDNGVGLVQGTFSGYPEGSIFTHKQVNAFRLSYVGGNGNDITLTALTGRNPTTTTVTSGRNPSVIGDAVMLTATVAGGSGTSGAVTFLDGATTLGIVTLSGTTASFSTTTLALGSHAITARYSGDAANGESTSAVLQQAVVANPPRLANLSTRGQVLTGNDVMIAGFVVGGSTAKKIVVNVAGPSLANYGITNALANPMLTIVRSSDNAVIATNNDWQVQASPGDVAAIQASGFQPNHAQEPAVILTLQPGAYTAIVQGVGETTGVALAGVFEVDHPESPLVNISTRGKVLTGNDVMIAGFIIGGDAAKTVVVNVAGPNLANYGVANALADPTLTVVRASDNTVIANNDDWQTQAKPADVAAIQATGFQPNNPKEPAAILTLQPGAYTVIVQGAGGTTGTGLVGVFAVP